MKKTHIIGALSALALFGMSSAANAAFVGTVPNATITNEAAPAAKLNVAAVATDVGYTTDFVLAQNSAFTVALTGGAMFIVDPMALSVAAAELALNPGQPFPRASVAYTVATIGGIGQGVALTGAGGAVNLAGNVTIPAALRDAVVDVTIAEGAVVDSLAAQITGGGALPNGPILTMVPQLEYSSIPSDNVTDLSSGNTTIGGATTTVVAGGVGRVDVVNNGTAFAIANDNVLLTINGNMAGVAAITDQGFGNYTSSQANGAAPVLGTVAGAFDIVGNVGHAVYTAAITAGALANETGIQVNYDGVTAIPEGTFTVTASHYVPAGGLSALSAVPAPSAALPVVNVANPGSHVTLNRVGPASTIKITDNASIVGGPAAIHYSVNNAAGAAVAPVAGAPALPATLAANATLKVTGAQLLATFPGLLGGSLTIYTSAGDVLVTHRQSNVNGTTINGVTTGAGTAGL